MNQETDNIIKPISNPADAIAEFAGEQYIEWLMDYITHQMSAWPELSAIRHSRPKIEKLRKFILQRYIAAQAFAGGKEGEPGFLGFAIANLSESDDPEAEHALEILEKMKLEKMDGQTAGSGGTGQHHELWHRLMRALGTSDEEINRAEPKVWTRNYIAELSDLYSNGEWQEVAGAFAAFERSMQEENRIISEFLRANTPVSDSELEVLRNSSADQKYVVSNGHILEKVVFDTENKKLVWDGVVRQLQVGKEFLASLLQHLEN